MSATKVGQRVYVRCVKRIGRVCQIDKVDVAVDFGDGPTRVFLNDDDVWPVPCICGLSEPGPSLKLAFDVLSGRAELVACPVHNPNAYYGKYGHES